MLSILSLIVFIGGCSTNSKSIAEAKPVVSAINESKIESDNVALYTMYVDEEGRRWRCVHDGRRYTCTYTGVTQDASSK